MFLQDGRSKIESLLESGTDGKEELCGNGGTMKKFCKRLISLTLSASLLFTSGALVSAAPASDPDMLIIAAEGEAPQGVSDDPERGDAAENGGGATGTITESPSEIKGEIITDVNNDDVKIEAKDKPYLALGANLTDEQRGIVLALMGIAPENLANYDVVYITNEEEHQYLESYIDASKIGTRALSSVVIVEREKGNGINISTQNINYCTVGMYKNALTTAGVTDADIIVAGPTPISGTAALVGIFKAYQEMTGEEIQEEVVDAALHELVVTGRLEESIEGLTKEEVEEFVAYIKSVIAEKGLSDEASINEAIDEACDKYGVTLSDEERGMIVDLLLKITSLGIDLSGLVDYAAKLYDNFKNGGGFFEVIGDFFSELFRSVGDFFKNLFNR